MVEAAARRANAVRRLVEDMFACVVAVVAVVAVVLVLALAMFLSLIFGDLVWSSFLREFLTCPDCFLAGTRQVAIYMNQDNSFKVFRLPLYKEMGIVGRQMVFDVS